jgi:hypothetical protein
MLYSEIIAVCSEIHTKHINTLCGQNVGFFNVLSSVVHKLTTRISTSNKVHNFLQDLTFSNPRVFWLWNPRFCNRVDISVDTNVSKEHAPSIFRNEVRNVKMRLGYTLE